MFDPWTATLDEAMVAHVDHDGGPEGPLFKWHVAREIEALKQDIDAGDGFVVLHCIRLCVTHGLVAPEWLAYAFNRRYYQVSSCRVGTWDEAFGKPYPGKHLAKLRQRRELKFDVYLRVSESTQAIDEALFERVGHEFGIGKTLCSELYYEAKKLLR